MEFKFVQTDSQQHCFATVDLTCCCCLTGNRRHRTIAGTQQQWQLQLAMFDIIELIWSLCEILFIEALPGKLNLFIIWVIGSDNTLVMIIYFALHDLTPC